jgi:hypothetical protein
MSIIAIIIILISLVIYLSWKRFNKLYNNGKVRLYNLKVIKSFDHFISVNGIANQGDYIVMDNVNFKIIAAVEKNNYSLILLNNPIYLNKGDIVTIMSNK